MRLATMQLNATLGVLVWFSFASGQTATTAGAETATTSIANDAKVKTDEATIPAPQVWIHLIGGRRIQVDEVTQSTDGIWYTRDNVSTFLDAARFVRIERPAERPPDSGAGSVAKRKWSISDSAKVEAFFRSRFGRSLPLTALGQSDLHDRWGWDHRNGMDVGLHPDSEEGKALIDFLKQEQIPFLAFRTFIPGVATGPHIHVGNGSPRLRSR